MQINPVHVSDVSFYTPCKCQNTRGFLIFSGTIEGDQWHGWVNPLSANPTKWSTTLKQFIGKLPTNCLSVFDHFVGFVLKGLIIFENL